MTGLVRVALPHSMANLTPTSPNPEPPSGEVDPDLLLLKQLQAGEVTALATLYDRYAKLVYGIALKVLGHAADAEDLTQEVFLEFWKRPNCKPGRGYLIRYLITLTRSRGIDRLRAQGRQQKLRRTLWNSPSPSGEVNQPLEYATQSERAAKVHQALQQLPDKQRQVLELAYQQGYSQSEIAEYLATPLGTVKTLTRKGLRLMREMLHDFTDPS
jgi:RNA polymerase sigma-70 factor (ECF subfamily)